MTVHQIDPRPRRALVFTPMEQHRRHLVEAAVLAEQLGYDTVLVPEGWGLDSGVVLTEIALKTSRIRIGTGIVSVWGRSPATLAMLAASLDDVSGGRFTLGLGASTPLLAERFHDVAFHRPADRLGDVVGAIRVLLEGGRATPSVTTQPGLRLGVPARTELPIWVAAHGPRATRIAATCADGWFPALVPIDRLTALRAAVPAPTGAGSRSPVLVAGPMVAAGTESRESVQQLVGWYLAGMGPFYGDFVASCGFGDEVAALRSANPRPTPGAIDWPRAADPLLDQLAAFGESEAVAHTLAAWDLRADIVAVCVGPGPLDDVLAAVDAGAPPREPADARGPGPPRVRAPATPSRSAGGARSGSSASTTPSITRPPTTSG